MRMALRHSARWILRGLLPILGFALACAVARPGAPTPLAPADRYEEIRDEVRMLGEPDMVEAADEEPEGEGDEAALDSEDSLEDTAEDDHEYDFNFDGWSTWDWVA